jgi:hypothetical protein
MSEHAENFYKSVREYLSIQAELISVSEGQVINVGDTFTIRFTVKNNAHNKWYDDQPLIVFQDLMISVYETDWASPLNKVYYQPLPIELLAMTESTSIDIEFKASKAIEDILPWWPLDEEKYAMVKLYANLDFKRFCRYSWSSSFSADIEPEGIG